MLRLTAIDSVSLAGILDCHISAARTRITTFEREVAVLQFKGAVIRALSDEASGVVEMWTVQPDTGDLMASKEGVMGSMENMLLESRIELDYWLFVKVRRRQPDLPTGFW